jgi:hypothetical protein
MKSLDAINADNNKITNLGTPTADTDAATKAYADSVGGGSANHAYYQKLAALLEPDAYIGHHLGTGNYAVGSPPLAFMFGWSMRGPVGGRIERRNLAAPLWLKNITLTGLEASSSAVFLDPSVPTYADARDTYFDRLNALTGLDTKYAYVSSGSETKPLLPGPYGSMLTHVHCFNFAWVALGAPFYATGALPLDNELGDGTTDWIRFAYACNIPLHKSMACRIMSGAAGGTGSPYGSLTYVILPSTWPAATDSTSYDFRDDFMGATLDTTTDWTRTQSTAGNVEIDTNFAWCKLVGNGSWGTNGAFSQASIARANGKVFMCDVYTDFGSASNALAVGFHDGAGHSYTDFAHAVVFTTGGTLQVYENGVQRGTGLGSGYSPGCTYRVRITLGASNAAAYEIQGGPQYGPIGGASWTAITPGTTSSATTPLHAGMTISNATTCYVGDVRVYTP